MKNPLKNKRKGLVKKSYKFANNTKNINLKKEELNDSENSEKESEIEKDDKIIKKKRNKKKKYKC